MAFIRRVPVLAATWFLLAVPYASALALETGVIAGKVVNERGAPAAGVPVSIVDLRRQMSTDETGAFRFDSVPVGVYILEANSPRFGRGLSRVEVSANQEVEIDLTLDLDVHLEAIVVSARPDARSTDEVAQPVRVLSCPELALRRESTLGETLAREPGVSSTYFGPGASRPIIRGLGGDRIRILQDGIGSADASSTSPDHAVSFDPLTAEQIEVVRGPATLLYGSSAVGGVVNVIETRIPDNVPDRVVRGSADLSLGSVANERSGGLALEAGKGAFAARGELQARKSDDVDVPGFAESAAVRAEEEAEGGEEEEEGHGEVVGTLPNTAIESTGGSLGASLVGEAGFLGLSVGGFDTLYGIPGGAHAHEEAPVEGEALAEEEGPVRIDLRQRRLDARGAVTRPFGPFRTVKLRFGVADYEHQELEGDEIGTTFRNDAWEGRLAAVHKPFGSATGSFGLQVARRDFEAIGAEAFVPPTETRSWAVFAFEEIGRRAWRLQLGGRYEDQNVDALGEAAATRSFDGLSGSAGVVWRGGQGYSVGVTVARSVKLPNAEELYSNGPHIATRAFEVGNPDLDKERSLGVDLSLRKRTGRVRGELSVFANRFDDYIFDSLTGEEEDGLQVVQFVQRDAEFYGGEAQVALDLLHSEPHHLDLELSGDVVRGSLRAGGGPLPRITPGRVGAALHYSSDRWNGRIEARSVLEQDRVTEFERPTDGHTFLNASLGYRFFAGRTVWDLVLRGTNLTDAEGRNHLSFLKDFVPLPGRDVRLNLRMLF